MKNKWNNFFKHIFLYDYIYLGICVVLSMLLYLCDMRFRLWVYVVLVLIFGILFLIGLIRKFNKDKLMVMIVLSSLTVLAFICGPFLLFVLAIAYSPEHVVELEGSKYVAVVKSFLDVDVYYYDYCGPMLMGTKLRVHGYFGEGGFDPIESPENIKKITYSFYDKDGNVEATREDVLDKHLIREEITTNNIAEEIREEDKLKIEDAEVLYEYKKDDHILRFTNVDSVLGQNQLVSVIESLDNGKTFDLKTNGVIQVSNEAKFIFFDESIGFAINTGKIHLDQSKTSIYVTNDGGKTLEESKIIYETDSKDTLDIDGLPYMEDGKLKLKCLEYVNKYEDKELIFVSEDKGKSWKLEK